LFMPIKLEHTTERLTRRTGLVLVNRFGDTIKLPSQINRAFPLPGSNRGLPASDYALTLVEMMIDGAVCLEDVRLFENDDAYSALTERDGYPSSDAIGDWLRRHGGPDGERRLWTVISNLQNTMTGGSGLTLDIDGTIIEADKGDAEMSYKGIRGYHPLLGACTELGLFVGSRFQQGNAAPQEELVSFIHHCEKNLPGRFSTVRSDSAAYNSPVINDCFSCNRRFTITADQDTAVMERVRKIAKNAWQQGRNHDGSKADYHVAETVHTMEKTTKAFRLVIKRSRRTQQADLFDGQYHYWIVATNFSEQEKNAQAVLDFHNGRGEMERLIGELKHHYNLDHLPCGQFGANGLYFTIGLLAFTLVQLLKRHYFGNDWKRKSIRSLRYYWLHLPSRIVSHARYTIARIATSLATFQEMNALYLRLLLAPAPS
jgi:hypothetical protein